MEFVVNNNKKFQEYSLRFFSLSKRRGYWKARTVMSLVVGSQRPFQIKRLPMPQMSLDCKMLCVQLKKERSQLRVGLRFGCQITDCYLGERGGRLASLVQLNVGRDFRVEKEV